MMLKQGLYTVYVPLRLLCSIDGLEMRDALEGIHSSEEREQAIRSGGSRWK